MADHYSWGDDMGLDFPGIVMPGDPIVVALTVPDDDGVRRTTRWSFPDARGADVFEALIKQDPYLTTHNYTIVRTGG